MSYNNIGLSTTRGSATNGFVQRNLSHVRPRDDYRQGGGKAGRDDRRFDDKAGMRAPDKGILEHERKRRVEVQCMELRVRLEDDGLGEEEIEGGVEQLRRRLIDEMDRRSGTAAGTERHDDGGQMAGYSRREVKALRPSDTHAWRAAKAGETEKMSRAFGIRADYREGDAFDRELQERKRQERIEERRRRDDERERAAEERRRREREDVKRRDDRRSSKRTEDDDKYDRRHPGRSYDDHNDSSRRSPYQARPSRRRRSSSFSSSRSRSRSPTPRSHKRRRSTSYDSRDRSISPPRRRGRDRSVSTSSSRSSSRSRSPRTRHSPSRRRSRSPYRSPQRRRSAHRRPRSPSFSSSPSPKARRRRSYDSDRDSNRSRSPVRDQRHAADRRSMDSPVHSSPHRRRREGTRSASIVSSASDRSDLRSSTVNQSDSISRRVPALPPGPPPVRPPGL